MIPWYKSKTLWFNLLALIVAIATVFGFADFNPSAKWTEIIGVVVSVVNLVLRIITKTAIRSPLNRG